jgi:transcriptional regulator with XRE-family HTH domain
MSAATAFAIQRAIRAERARLGLTQQALADRLGDGWSRSRIAAIETGERSVNAHELPELCTALGVTLDTLLHMAPEAERIALGL